MGLGITNLSGNGGEVIISFSGSCYSNVSSPYFISVLVTVKGSVMASVSVSSCCLFLFSLGLLGQNCNLRINYASLDWCLV